MCFYPLFVLVFLCDAFSCVILLKIGIPIELEGESSMISVCMATYNGEKYLKRSTGLYFKADSK